MCERGGACVFVCVHVGVCFGCVAWPGRLHGSVTVPCSWRGPAVREDFKSWSVESSRAAASGPRAHDRSGYHSVCV